MQGRWGSLSCPGRDLEVFRVVTEFHIRQWCLNQPNWRRMINAMEEMYQPIMEDLSTKHGGFAGFAQKGRVVSKHGHQT